jgi:methionyl-tRNA formyltransferase
LYFGMRGAFSAIPLAQLLASGVDVRAVVMVAEDAGAPALVAAPPPALPRADIILEPAQPDIAQLALRARIPVVQVADLRHAQTLELIGGYAADVALVACFPSLVPRALRGLPAHGFFNLHPSLLPRLRGPAPLFWVFREGHSGGVTVHAMSGKLDAGPIAGQLPIQFPDGTTYVKAERICAQWGARLLLDTLAALAQDGVRAYAQDESQASHYPAPGRADFAVNPGWPARRAFNFMRGVEGYGEAIVVLDGQERSVRHAVEWRPGTPALAVARDERWVRFADGAVRVHLAPESAR